MSSIAVEHFVELLNSGGSIEYVSATDFAYPPGVYVGPTSLPMDKRIVEEIELGHTVRDWIESHGG